MKRKPNAWQVAYNQQFVGKTIIKFEFVDVGEFFIPTFTFSDGTFAQVWCDPGPTSSTIRASPPPTPMSSSITATTTNPSRKSTPPSPASLPATNRPSSRPSKIKANHSPGKANRNPTPPPPLPLPKG